MYFRMPFANIISGLPDLLLALTFLVTWIDPFALGGDMVPFLFQVMLLEFIIIHSTGFMGALMFVKKDRKFKILAGLGLGTFYMIFAAAFGFGFHSWWPVITFGGLLFNRLLSILTGQAPDGEEMFFTMKMWAASVVFYLFTIAIVMILPFPALGVSTEQLGQLDVSGEFVEKPHLVMAWGFLYFLFTSVLEFSSSGKNNPAQSVIRPVE